MSSSSTQEQLICVSVDGEGESSLLKTSNKLFFKAYHTQKSRQTCV